MFRLLVILFSAILVSGLLPSHAQDTGDRTPVVIPNTETFSMTSSITEQEYQIFVSLPDNYARTGANTRYPVVYLLDADFYFGAVSEFVKIQRLVEELPHVIVVGIGYVSRPLDRRIADMWDNPVLFQNFLSDELLPMIDEQYRTDADGSTRTLMGHSLGGHYVLYTLFTRPDLFGRYIALSPGGPLWDEIVSREEAYADEHSTLPVRLFVASTDEEIGLIQPLLTTIEAREYEGLETRLRVFDDTTHTSSAMAGLTIGLHDIYQEDFAAP